MISTLFNFFLWLPPQAWQVFIKDPAEWTAAILFLASLIVQIYQHRKKANIDGYEGRLGPDQAISELILFIDNLGNRRISVQECGVKLWNGECIKAYANQGTFTLEPADRRYQRYDGLGLEKERTVPQIYYYYFIDGSGKI